jgi:2-keto-4-pentenoate hydratase
VPLVGFLTNRALLPSGSMLSLSGWTKPAAEPELTVYLGKNLPAGADRDTTRAAIAGLGPVIELADVDHPSDDVEGTLACDIYQRHIILGRKDPTRAGGILDGLTAHVLRNGAEIANISDPLALQELTGELIDIVRHVANLLAAFDETLQAGQIIIAGSIIPPMWIEPGEEIVFDLAPVDTIAIRFAPPSNQTL